MIVQSKNVIFLPPAVQSFTYVCLIIDCYLKSITFLDTAVTVNDNATTLEVLKPIKSHMNNIRELVLLIQYVVVCPSKKIFYLKGG